MVSENDLDGLAQHRAAGVLDSHARGHDRALAAEIGIEAGLVVEHANPDDIVGNLRLGRGYAKTGGCKDRDNGKLKLHDIPQGLRPDYCLQPSPPLIGRTAIPLLAPAARPDDSHAFIHLAWYCRKSTRAAPPAP
jgi:hypothetical protein